nr:putative ribonuclease H-like domain-containing protein [Tanacetum cinerariifolium]
MTGNLQLLRNIVEKFMGTVRFRNDHFTAIIGYGDYVQGNLMICHREMICLPDHEIRISTISLFLRWRLLLQEKQESSLLPKLVPSTKSKLELLHMDLCRPMRVTSINGEKYILVIVDDYSRYTRVYFLRTKDEAPDMIIDFVIQVQRNLKAQILKIRTDNGTEFKTEKLRAFYAKLGIFHKTSIARTPQQNGVVERRNRTLVEAARTMLIFSKAPEFLWVEAIATACFTHNRSIVHTRHNKTPYELIRGRKPNVQYFYVLGSLCIR